LDKALQYLRKVEKNANKVSDVLQGHTNIVMTWLQGIFVLVLAVDRK
jgi:hypothetical protein